MDNSNQERKNSLLYWASSLPTYKKFGHNKTQSSRIKAKAEDFEDVFLLQEILKNDVDPIYFSNNDLNNTDNHNNTTDSDQRLSKSVSFITPLAYLIDKMKKYYAQQEGGHLIPLYLTPSSAIISLGGGNTNEISRLLQLLLVCAVNCPNAKKFLSEIKRMDQNIQTQLMSAIIELTASTEDTLENTDQLLLDHEINILNNTKEELTQECLDLCRQLSKMTEEKQELSAENQRLKSQLKTDNDHERSLNNLNYELEVLMSKWDEAQTTKTDLREQIENLTRKIETQGKEKTTIENACRQKDDELTKLQASEKELKYMNHDLKSQVEKLKTLNEKLEKEKMEMTKTVENIQHSHKLELDEIRKENGKLINKLQKLEQVADTEKEISIPHKKEMELIQMDLERLKNENHEKINESEENFKQLQLKNEKLEEQLKFANEEISRLSTDHRAITERKLDLEKATAVQEMEGKLIMSTFYNYGINLERYVVEQRRNNALCQNPHINQHPHTSLIQSHRQGIPQRFPINNEFHSFEIEEGQKTPTNPDIFYL